MAWEWERVMMESEEFTKWGGRRRDINSPVARVNSYRAEEIGRWVRWSVFGELLRCCCVVSPSHTYHHSSDTILDLLLAVNKPKKLYFPFLSIIYIIKGSILIISTISKLLLYSAADSWQSGWLFTKTRSKWWRGLRGEEWPSCSQSTSSCPLHSGL